MISFVNDYQEGASTEILKRLNENNSTPMPGYSGDEICKSAEAKIKDACNCPDAQVYFLVGGTQTNAIVIDSMLDGYEGVLCCETGHINAHESGAPEFTGHKVLTVPHHNGKIAAEDLAEYMRAFYANESHEHMVFPGMVYVSHPTEYGTLYTKKELEDIKAICEKYDMDLYLDGARLGYALATPESDVTLEDIARITDVFYIGGTKVGALFGEAVVFTKHNMPKYFATRVKQHGAMLAKGWLLGLQFDTLFTDRLYFKNGENGIKCANLLRAGLSAKGYKFFIENPTNQIFIIVSREKVEQMRNIVGFEVWEEYDKDNLVIRFVTSFMTKEENVNALLKIM